MTVGELLDRVGAAVYAEQCFSWNEEDGAVLWRDGEFFSPTDTSPTGGSLTLDVPTSRGWKMGKATLKVSVVPPPAKRSETGDMRVCALYRSGSRFSSTMFEVVANRRNGEHVLRTNLGGKPGRWVEERSPMHYEAGQRYRVECMIDFERGLVRSAWYPEGEDGALTDLSTRPEWGSKWIQPRGLRATIGSVASTEFWPAFGWQFLDLEIECLPASGE